MLLGIWFHFTFLDLIWTPFGYDLFSYLIICGSGFKIQELTVFLVTGFINFGVTNQGPQVSFNFDVEDSMLVLYYEIADIRCCELLNIFEAISYYRSQAFSLHSPRSSLPLVTCSSPHRTSKEGDILHLHRHLFITLGADFTTHGFIFKGDIYHIIRCYSHDFNS